MSQPHSKKLKAADNTQAAMALFKRSLTSGSSQGSSDHPDPDSQHQTTSESSDPDSHHQTTSESSDPDSHHQTTSESSDPDSQHQTTWESSLPPPTTSKPLLHNPTMPSSSIPAPPFDRPVSVRSKRQIEKDEARKAELREMKKRGLKIQLSSQYNPIKKKLEIMGTYIRDPEFDSFEIKRLRQENEELKAKIVTLEEKTSNQDAVILDLKQKLDSLNVPYGVPTAHLSAPASSTR